MATTKCGRCGKALPRGDKLAEIAHAAACPKTLFSSGPYVWGKSRPAFKSGTKK